MHVFTVRVGYAGRATLWKSSCHHQTQEVWRSFLHFTVWGGKLALSKVFLQGLVDEEADHGLRDASIRCSQASVEASNPFCFVNIASTLQCIHLLLPSGPKESRRLCSLVPVKTLVHIWASCICKDKKQGMQNTSNQSPISLSRNTNRMKSCHPPNCLLFDKRSKLGTC